MTIQVTDRGYKMPYPRYRTEGSYAGGYATYTETAFNGTVTTTVTDGVWPLYVGETKGTRDWVTPGYHTRVARGEVINHSFWSRKISRGHSLVGHKVQRNSGSGSTIKFYERDYYYTIPQAHPGESRPSGVPISALEAEAGTSALSGVNATDIQAIVELAEAHKVRESFKLRLGDFNKYLKRMLRSRSGLHMVSISGDELSKVVESNWLRYRYGIMPLLYLMEDSIVGTRVRTSRQTSRGFANWTTSGTSVYAPTPGNFFADEWTTNWDYEVSVRAGVMYRPDFRANQFGVSLRELPSAAWELTPYSFVVDWFGNVGPWIRSHAMNIGVKHLASWTTRKEKYSFDTSLSSTWRNYTGHTCLRVPSGSFKTTVETTSRSVGAHRGLAFRRSSIYNLPRDQRLVDSYSLAMQNLRRLMTSR